MHDRLCERLQACFICIGNLLAALSHERIARQQINSIHSLKLGLE